VLIQFEDVAVVSGDKLGDGRYKTFAIRTVDQNNGGVFLLSMCFSVQIAMG